MDRQRNKISWHVHDLLKRDIATVVDVSNWLKDNAVKPREIANRNVSKRMLARKIAAAMCLKAAEGDIQACREVMDRTEGKVADVVITGSIGELVAALEAGRERLLQSRSEPLAIEGEIIQPLDIVVAPTNACPEEPHQQPISIDSTTSK